MEEAWARPKVNRAAAEKTLQRRRLGAFWRALTSYAGSSSALGKKLPFLELAWLPYYWIRVETPAGSSAPLHETVIEGFSGAFSRIDPETFEISQSALGPRFEPALLPADAEGRARAVLLAALSYSRTGGRAAELGPTREIRILHYPYWAYYYERRPGRIDLRLLDAMNATRPGAKTRQSLLAAFLRDRASDIASAT